MVANSLCFKEAREARLSDRIKQDEHVAHVVAHYGGVRHEADAEGKRPYMGMCFEDAVRDLVLGENFQSLGEDGKCCFAT